MEGLVQPYYAWRTQQLLADGALTVSVDGLARPHQRFAAAMVGRTQRLLAIPITLTAGPADITFRSVDRAVVDAANGGQPAGALANYGPGYSWDALIGAGMPKRFTRWLVLHEFGHTLGLEHPFDTRDGDTAGDLSTNETVMAYRMGRRLPLRWRQLDRDALTGVWGRRGSVPSAPAAAAA